MDDRYTTVRITEEDGNLLESLREQTGINKGRLVHDALKEKYGVKP